MCHCYVLTSFLHSKFRVNVIYSDPAKRSMLTGDFIVHDISCNYCKHTVGWTYDKAFKSSEEYKVGKFILEVKVLAEVK